MDSTQSLVAEWTENVRQVYASVNYSHEERYKVMEDTNPFEMTDDWYTIQAQLRQEGLDQARLLGADYLLVRYFLGHLLHHFNLAGKLSRPRLVVFFTELKLPF